jgi:DNA repair protein RadC
MEKVAEIEVSYRPSLTKNPIIKDASDAYDEFKKFYPLEKIALQETFMAMYLNQANRCIGVFELSKGGITGTVVDVRILLSIALKVAATSIILCHNHPSGNLKPSSSDISTTKQIKSACKYLDIKLTDHIIISPFCEYSSIMDEVI